MLKTFLNMALFVFVSIGALSYPVNAYAQSVSIQNGLGEFGFGWMFGRNGTCYVIMPKHVAGPFPRVTVSTPAPVESVTATVIAPFWQGIDLAIGIARGSIVDRCRADLSDLNETWNVTSAHQADLLRLTPTGEISRSRLRLDERTYLTFSGTLDDAGSVIGQGTSGAFAFVNGRPAGMAITSDDPSRATFIRSGEILVHVRRYLEEQGGAFVAASEAGAVAQTQNADALPLRFLESSVRASNPLFAPENLVGPGKFVFAPHSRMQFALGFDSVTPVSRVVIRSSPEAAETSPKSIILNWSREDDGANFRVWLRGEMGPDGVFDSGEVAPRDLRRLQVIVRDAWGSGDIVIDEVTAY